MLQNLPQQSIEKDIAWVIAGGLPDKEKRMALLGSRKSFQKESTVENDFLMDTIQVLELSYIFV